MGHFCKGCVARHSDTGASGLMSQVLRQSMAGGLKRKKGRKLRRLLNTHCINLGKGSTLVRSTVCHTPTIGCTCACRQPFKSRSGRQKRLHSWTRARGVSNQVLATLPALASSWSAFSPSYPCSKPVDCLLYNRFKVVSPKEHPRQTCAVSGVCVLHKDLEVGFI